MVRRLPKGVKYLYKSLLYNLKMCINILLLGIKFYKEVNYEDNRV